MPNIDILSFWSADLVSKLTKKILSLSSVVVSGLANETGRALCAANILKQETGKSLLMVTNDKKQIAGLVGSLRVFSAKKVTEFNLEQNPTNDSFIARRNLIKTLNLAYKLQKDNFGIAVAAYEDILQHLASPKVLEDGSWNLELGVKSQMVALFERLISMNYLTGQSMHVQPGEYYCMGDQLTVYPVNLDFPIRISLAFEEVEKRLF